jgi:hypothetical protein
VAKPKPQRFPSDDFEVTVEGETYHPHEGEWVEIFTDISVDDMLSGEALARIGLEMEAAKGDKDEVLRVAQLANEHFDVICVGLADRLVDWNWTDRRGNPLPKPDGSPDLLRRLTNAEVAYLMGLKRATQETPDERKNDLRPLPITSSATGSSRSRTSSGGGRSHAKR